MKTFIVLDSNIWTSQVGLQSKNGAAVRHFVRRVDATVVIPEVVELEVKRVLTQRMLDKRKAIVSNYRDLLPIMKTLPSLHLPSEEKITEAVASRILDLDVPTVRVPFDLNVARSSMLKAINHLPPSKSQEQFRDGVIWAHCLELLAEGNVYLVTDDRDFYEGRDHTKGLARELVDEASTCACIGEMKLLRNLTALLQDIRIPFDLPDRKIFQTVREGQRDAIDELLTAHGFGLAGDMKGEVAYFATEKAEEIYFRFSFSHPCEDVTGTGRRAGQLKLEGFGFVESGTRKARDVRLSHVLLDYPDWVPDGTARGTVSMSAHINAPIVHEIRFPLGTVGETEEERQ